MTDRPERWWRRPAFARVVIAPIASALLLLLAFPPFDLRLLVFVALVPWLAAFPYVERRQTWRAGLWFGLVFILGQMWWVNLLTHRWTGSALLGLVPWLIAGLLGMLYFGVLSLLVNLCCRSGRMWLVPLAWLAVEVWRSYMPLLAFPWGLIATPLAMYPALINDAAIFSVFGVGAWIVSGNMILVGAIRRRVPWKAGATFAIGLALSLWLYQRPVVGTERRILVGQPGVDVGFSNPDEARLEIGLAATRLVRLGDAQRVDLIVLPEGIADLQRHPLPFDFPHRAPLLFGAQDSEGKKSYQDAVTWDGTLHVAEKTRLVIFGEFVPGRDLLPFLKSFDLPSGDLSAGDRTTALPAGSMTVGPLICFEELFPDLGYRQWANGAQLLAVISMDDWFVGTPALEELRDSCVFRAVETGLPLVRSATTGYSLAVDPRGRILAQARPGGYEALIVSAKVR